MSNSIFYLKSSIQPKSLSRKKLKDILIYRDDLNNKLTEESKHEVNILNLDKYTEIDANR